MMDRIERIQQSFITRKTEENDTHDHIKHHDPDYYKNKKQSRDKWADHDDDMTDISVESLIVFFRGLIKDTDYQKNETKKPVAQSMTKAINAYGKQTKTTVSRYTYLDDDYEQIDDETVHAIIEKLQKIKSSGYEDINLIAGNGFIDSVQKTVEKYLSLE